MYVGVGCGGLGQLGGSWGWYALVLRNPIALRFSAWIWSDYGTVNLIVDAGEGKIPVAGEFQVVTAGRSDYQWQELKLNGKHLSWVYTDAVGVAAVRAALMPSAVSACQITKQCYAAFDPQKGTFVS